MKKNKKALALALGASVGLAVTTPSYANLVENGGFETGDFTGWTEDPANTGNFVGGDPHSGSFSAFDGSIRGLDVISQSVATLGGAGYNLSFWMKSADGEIPGGTEFLVKWDANVILDLKPVPNQGYTEYNFFVTAQPGGGDTLTFGLRNEGYYTQLDDVSLSPSIPGVPEAGATMGYVTLGLLALWGMKKNLGPLD